MSCHFLWGICWKEVRGVGWWIQVAGWAEFWSTNGLQLHGCSCRCWSTRPWGLSGSQSDVVLCWSFFGLFLESLLPILKTLPHLLTTSKTLWNKTLFLDFWCGYERDWPACPSHCQRLCAPHWSSPWWRYLYQKASQIFERYSNQIIESDILIRYLSQIFESDIWIRYSSSNTH